MNKILADLIVKTGLFTQCFVETKKIPADVPKEDRAEAGYYYIDDAGLSDEELNTALMAKQTLYLRTIKNILMFIFISSIVTAALVFIWAMI